MNRLTRREANDRIDCHEHTGFARAFMLVSWFLLFAAITKAAETNNLPGAFIDGTGSGWIALELKDFVHVNCKPETWSSSNGMIHCTGSPMGVIRTENIYTNFE